MTYQIIFTAEAEFSVEVEADSEEEARQKFKDNEANWGTLINTGNGHPGYVDDPAYGIIEEIIK